VATRRGWAGLSDDYKARLKGAGISYQDWRSGKSLKAARGHGGAYPSPAERREIIGRLDADQQTEADRQGIRRWSASRARPAWTKPGGKGHFPVSDELALRLWAAGVKNPKQWEDAPTFTPGRSGEPWSMRVLHKDGTYAELEIPWSQHDEALAMAIDASGEYPDLGQLTVAGTP